MTMADVPLARARVPRSPFLASQLDIMVPSGIHLTGRILPTDRDAKVIIKIERRAITFSSAVDELTSVETFNSDEVFSALPVSVGISENDLGQRGSSSWIVKDVFDESLDISTIGYGKSLTPSVPHNREL